MSDSTTTTRVDFGSYLDRLARMQTIRLSGTVQGASGLVIESVGPPASVGEICEVLSGRRRVPVEVVGFRDQKTISMPIGRMIGIQAGDRIVARGRYPQIAVGEELLGRVIDPGGEPLDDRGRIRARTVRSLYAEPTNPLDRKPTEGVLATGVKAIDACTTLGRGQRMGLFGGSGVGKSTLLAMMAKNTNADVNVLALVGERGREVRAFIEDELGDALERSVVVVATSEHSALMRIRAALAATTIAEHFRERGSHVLLLMDSLTRFAMAQREVGLAVGEPPSTKGYTPSVFNALPSLVERAGSMERGGSVTGIYTVLVEGDDLNDPVGDAARSLLDGHIVLSRALADRGHFPAIEVTASLSRLMAHIATSEHRALASRLRAHLGALAEANDLIQIGAYKSGTSPEVDAALARRSDIEKFLRQDLFEASTFDGAIAELASIVGDGNEST